MPSISSRRMSAWATWRAVSSIMWTWIQRSETCPMRGWGGGVVQGVGCGGGTGSVAGLLVVGKPMCG